MSFTKALTPNTMAFLVRGPPWASRDREPQPQGQPLPQIQAAPPPLGPEGTHRAGEGSGGPGCCVVSPQAEPPRDAPHPARGPVRAGQEEAEEALPEQIRLGRALA